MSAAPTWSLDELVPGGPSGADFAQRVAELMAALDALVARADALPSPGQDLDAWSSLLRALTEARDDMQELSTIANCWSSADATGRAPGRASAAAAGLRRRWQRGYVPVEARLGRATDAEIEALTARPELAEHVPHIHQLRRDAALKLPEAQQSLAVELSRDGSEAWARLYQRRAGALMGALPSGERLSASQLQNRLSHPEADARAEALAAMEAAWGEVEDDCAMALSHIYGARQTVQDRLGVDALAEPLRRARMRRETLDAMMEAAARARPLMQRYLGLKARALGLPRLGWQDLSAPLPSDGATSQLSWGEASAFVREHAGAWNPELRAFIDRALDERWVEAEDRPGKRAGAWCGGLPLSGQSRVFMTFGGSQRSMITLAHELGHAFHNEVLLRAHPAHRRITSTLAETASIFCESLVRDAALRAASEPAERLGLLDARLTAGATFLLDLPARYQFDHALHALRRQGELEPEALSAAMLDAQREAFGADTLSAWHPRYWCSKLHYYLHRVPFYNFPYTFGYLFASLVYQRAQVEGPSYHGRYVELLQRSGWDYTEPMVMELLGVDLTDPEAWWQGVAPLEADLAAYEALLG